MPNKSVSTPRFKRVLVTGAAGFVGHHLVNELRSAGHVVATTDALPADAPAAAGLPSYTSADLRDRDSMRALVRKFKPDAVIHLAAISFVPDGAKDPSLILSVNIAGTLNVAEALRAEAPRARMLFISTAQVYGTATASSAEFPLREDSPLLPLSLYAITKVAAEHALLAMSATHGFDVVIARPGNHIGPGQSPKFVATSFAAQVLEAKAGRLKKMRVGNLESIRDFSDVRDIARAYRLLVEKGRTGMAYNITTDNHVRIGELLSTLQRLAGTSVKTETDPALYRPTDAFQSIDTTRLFADTGWIPRLSLEQTLGDILASLEAQHPTAGKPQ